MCSACGAGNRAAPQATHGSHGTHTSHGSTSAPRSSTTTSTATSTTSAPPAPARCTFADLVISAGPTAAGLGHEGATILFENVAATPCALSGYPGIAALSATGRQVQQAQRTLSGYLGGMRTGSTTPPLVVLQPRATASAMVEGTDVPEGTVSSCPTFPALLVTPPTSTTSKRLTAPLPGCSPLQVHPVVSGTTGSTT